MSDNRRCTTEYQEMISAYIDGDLDAAERQRLLAHMATCAECRHTLETYRQIGSQVRALPRAIPPPDLRDAIYAETVDTQSRKVYLLSSRLGYSVAALAAVALIFVVAVYLLINGYQRSIDPEVVASQPVNGVLWPLSRPVEITFNKEMDRDSVESALSIIPASERDRLSRTWDGNTLILGQNQTLRSDTSYTIRITIDARDKWGQSLKSEFRLQFASSDSFALQTPEPLPTPTPTQEPTAVPTATPPPETQATATSNEAVSPAQPTDDKTPSPTATPSELSDSPTTTDGATGATEPPIVNDPDPTATPVPQEPTSQPEPTPTATDVPTATPEPTWTPQPLPTATATATATEPAPTATPDSIPVVGAFGNVYWGNDIVLGRLGAPEASAASITGVELDFQHGAMFSRSDTSQTYILESATGVWSVLPSSADSTNSEPAPDPDTWIPGGSLGALWSSEAWVQSALGYALAPSGTVFESRVQRFESGTMLMSSSGQVYVIYADGTWELYPDPGA
ncbi:hypothetical protein BH23CHL2_BH23CHL2_17170 [soil metagenome]